MPYCAAHKNEYEGHCSGCSVDSSFAQEAVRTDMRIAITTGTMRAKALAPINGTVNPLPTEADPRLKRIIEMI